MLMPASTGEVVEIVRLAVAHRVPLVPQGGNTGMAAGATPPADGSAILLSLRRMNRIRSISADSRLAVAEAGVVLATLHDEIGRASCRERVYISVGAQSLIISRTCEEILH